MQILLTGATGFLGNNLLRILLEDGHDVCVTVRQGFDPRPLDGLNVETIECDLVEPSGIVSSIESVELVIHSAALIQIGWSNLSRSRQINVEATRQLAQAARLKNVRMIYVSTVDVLATGTRSRPATELDRDPPKPACTYVVTKCEAEAAFQEQVALGLDGVIVNPGFMVGPWDWKPSSGQMLLAVAKQFTPLAPSGGCSVVDVRDVACGIIAAIEHGRSGENYILAGENISYLELWQRMAQVADARPPVGKLPPWINWSAGRVGDLIASVTGNEPQVNSAATQMGSLLHWYSSDKAIRELGYRIGNTNDALSDSWTWFESHGYV